MAKGQMRVPKEKKKPKADKDKPKQLSAYKLAQMQGTVRQPLQHAAGQEALSASLFCRCRSAGVGPAGVLGHFQAGEQLDIAREAAEFRQAPRSASFARTYISPNPA